MLDILILYSLHKQEQTFYGLAKNIADLFGEISITSHGALHPALKRLMAENLLIIRKKMSDGGKRYTYYSVSKNFQEGFNKKFTDLNFSRTETLEAFLTGLKARIYTYELLDKQFSEEFKEKMLLKLDYFDKKIRAKNENSYIEFNDVQKKISEIYLNEIAEYKTIMNALD